mgnify:CR=1 FL=1
MANDMSELAKMDPMVRKLQSEMEGLGEAITNEDKNEARARINEIQKFADYISDDLHAIFHKANGPQGPNDVFAGGAPVRRFNETEHVIDVTNRDQVLSGFIPPHRVGGIMRKHQGINRWSDES